MTMMAYAIAHTLLSVHHHAATLAQYRECRAAIVRRVGRIAGGNGADTQNPALTVRDACHGLRMSHAQSAHLRFFAGKWEAMTNS
jgi:hypothetical protein